MRKSRVVSAGLLALVAGLYLSTSSSAPEADPEGPSRSNASTEAPLRTMTHASAVASQDVAPAVAPNDAAADDTVRAMPVDATTYLPGERLVRLTDPMELGEIADRYELDVVKPVGHSGYAVVRGTPEDLGLLALDPSVVAMAPNAIVRGASEVSDADDVLNGTSYSNSFSANLATGGSDRNKQWHMDKVDPPQASGLAGEIVVAVLDTGVAYETAVRYGVSYAAAPSLASNPIVAPYDFINDDPHANDDHQHGTHIASIIASDGAIKGTAPGAGLMPIKVLDEHNEGTEYELVEGVWWAVNNGADIINMSLSFGAMYQPSLALQEALQAAADADIMMVAAAGNSGLDQVSWPAASPLVLAVGAAELTATQSIYNNQKLATYGNVSASIELVAPGGNLATDINNDGLPDGIIGETINPADPTDVGYWLMAGTSQAAAQISGMGVELLRAGLSALDAESVMKDKAENPHPTGGRGSGFADMDWGVPSFQPPHRQYYAALMPFLQHNSSTQEVRPRARVTVFLENGFKAANVKVSGSLWGNGDGMVTCRTDAEGSCFLVGAWVPRYTDGVENKAAWKFAVETVTPRRADDIGDLGRSYRPRAAITTNDGFQEVVGAMDADDSLQNAVLAFSWSDSDYSGLGTVADGFSITDSGSGLASLPLGIVMTRPTVGDLGSTSTQMLGTQAGDVPLTLLHLDGTGLKSLPLGLRLDPVQPVTIAFLDGSGLKSLPLGFKPQDAYGDGKLEKLDQPTTLTGTAVGHRLEQGGWRISGYGAASVIGSSSSLGIDVSMVSDAVHMDGTSDGMMDTGDIAGSNLQAIRLD